MGDTVTRPRAVPVAVKRLELLAFEAPLRARLAVAAGSTSAQSRTILARRSNAGALAVGAAADALGRIRDRPRRYPWRTCATAARIAAARLLACVSPHGAALSTAAIGVAGGTAQNGWKWGGLPRGAIFLPDPQSAPEARRYRAVLAQRETCGAGKADKTPAFSGWVVLGP